MAEENATAGVFVSISVSVFVALVALSRSCEAQSNCLAAKTCAPLDTSTCSFQNLVSPAGYRLFNTTSDAGSLAGLERGVCAPGERQNLIDDELVCLRARSYPSALNAEITDAAGTSDHERACGAWMDAGNGLERTTWAFYDEADVTADVVDAMNARLRIRGGGSNPSKFRAACTRMIVNNAGGPAGTLAYDHLVAMLPGTITTKAQALAGVGVLAAHYCDAPALVGLTFDVARSVGIAINITEGQTFTSAEMHEYLYAADATRPVRDAAKTFSDAMAAIETPATVSHADAVLVYTGATVGTSVESTSVDPWLYADGALPSLARFITAYEAQGGDAARAYLLGAAARCAFAVRNVVTGEMGDTNTVRMRRRPDPAPKPVVDNLVPAALGRLRSLAASADRLSTVTPAVALAATTVTWSALGRRSKLASSTRYHATSACDTALAAAFPDHLDEIAFELLIPEFLYTRLGTLVSDLRPAVASAIANSIFAPVLADPAKASSIAASSVVHVAGAPTGTWGGPSSSLSAVAQASFTSADGALVMLLKQARSLFLHRMALVQDRTNNVCDMPSLFSATSRNAYNLPSHGCSMLLPGILVPPIASVNYDDDSLRSRIGWVIAHEIAHSTAAVAFNQPAMDTLLVGYAPSTQTEALADVIAATAVLQRFPQIGNETLCQHLSQLWCARKRHSFTRLFYLVEAGSHPAPNERGDLACAFLRRHFG
jgi:hypothetical protein